MSLIKCKACGGIVSKKAPACPMCGEPQKRTSKFAVAFLIVMFIALAIGISDFDNRESRRVAEGSAETAGMFEITATKLYELYSYDELKAASIYEGKTIIVTGKVVTRDRDIMDLPYLGLKTSSRKTVQCNFPKDRLAQVSSVKVGQEVRLKGKVTTMIFGHVLLMNCALLN